MIRLYIAGFAVAAALLSPCFQPAFSQQSGHPPVPGQQYGFGLEQHLPLHGSEPEFKPWVPPGTELHYNVSYVPGSKNDDQTLNLYLPANPRKKKLPMIVFIHGGAWKGGSKWFYGAAPLVKDGFAVASINYRLVPYARWPAQIYDCKAAIRWLHAHADQYHIDPQHIGVWGSSAGGHLALLLGTTAGVKELEGNEGHLNYSSKVQCVCDWFGPTDLTDVHGSTDNGGKTIREALEGLLGGPIALNLAKARQASPLTYVSKNAPPFLIVHGDRDQLVPLWQSEKLYKALRNCGVAATLIVLPNTGHGGPAMQGHGLAVVVRKFFADHLMVAGTKPAAQKRRR